MTRSPVEWTAAPGHLHKPERTTGRAPRRLCPDWFSRRPTALPELTVAFGTRFQFVPYRGGAPMIQDLIAGQIDLTFTQGAPGGVANRKGADLSDAAGAGNR